jgi:tetratricopeptide (TPR) repeat protein
MDAVLSRFANDPAAAPVLKLMGDGRWRKARDAAKDLCKRDRERYLELLIAANVGLVRELIGKGLAKDAVSVVDYLATIAPAALVAGLRAELTAPVPKPTGGEPAGVDRALAWAAVLRAAAAVSNGAALTPADCAEIDLLVTDTFWPAAVAPADEASQVLKELAAVRAACEATGDGQWEQAQESLRGVPGQSVFRHWRMFLRGVRCWFQDQPEPARQCFAGLPPEGALARAARALAPEWVPPGPLPPATARVSLGLAMTGQPAAWAGPVLAAGSAWKAAKRVKAFEELQAGLKDAFPANEPGLPALLTAAVLPFRERMNDRDAAAADRLLERFDVWDDRRARRFSDSVLAVMRPLCLAETVMMGAPNLESHWGRVVELWNRGHGPNAVRDSLAWQWLGETLANQEDGRGPFGRPVVDFKRARKALDKAVQCDSANEAAWLALLGLLKKSGDAKARNRLLDDLAKRFPNNKAILLETGLQAVERKAFDKGLAALQAALALDPLDRQVKERIAIALVLQILEYRRKDRPQAALWTQLEPYLDDRTGRGQFMLSRWMARVRRALVETVPELAQAAFDDAVRLAPSAIERLFLEHSLASVYELKLRPGWQREWQEAKQGPGLKWATLLHLFEQHAFLVAIKAWSPRHNRHVVSLTTEVGTSLVTGDLSRDLDGTLVFLDQLDALSKEPNHSLQAAIMPCFKLFLGAVERATDSKRKPADPRIRLCGFILDERKAMPRVTATEKFFKELAALVAEAEAAGMAGVVTRAQALRGRWEQRAAREHARKESPKAAFDGDDDWDGDWGEDWDDDDDWEEADDWDDEAEDDDDGDADGGLPMAELFDIMIGLEVAVVTGDQKALDAAIRRMREFGMPEELIAEAVANAKANAGKPQFGRKPAKRKAKTPKKAKPAAKSNAKSTAKSTAKPPAAPPAPAPVPVPKPPKPPAADSNQLDLF